MAKAGKMVVAITLAPTGMRQQRPDEESLRRMLQPMTRLFPVLAVVSQRVRNNTTRTLRRRDLVDHQLLSKPFSSFSNL